MYVLCGDAIQNKVAFGHSRPHHHTCGRGKAPNSLVQRGRGMKVALEPGSHIGVLSDRLHLGTVVEVGRANALSEGSKIGKFMKQKKPKINSAGWVVLLINKSRLYTIQDASPT